jgi:hypothetical protein
MSEAVGPVRARPAASPAGGNESARSLPAAAGAHSGGGSSGISYQVLAAAINAQVALIYHTSVTLVQYPSQGDFPWYYENANQVFNNGTFGYISARVSPGDAAGLAKLSTPGGYPNAYAGLLSQIEYGLSSADAAAHDQDAVSEAAYGNAVLSQLKQATYQPSAANGGMLTVDPNTGAVSAGFQVGYGINTPLATISNGLQSGQPTVTVQVAAGNGTTATISYPGCQLVAVQPAAWQQATNTGWYDTDPITQAYSNGQQDVTGYRFVSPPSYNLGQLSSGGNFGRLVSLLISNAPVVTFAADTSAADPSAADTSAAFADGVSPDAVVGFYESLSLLNLGRSSAQELLALPDSAAAQTQPTVPQLQQSAYVVGACLDFISQD